MIFVSDMYLSEDHLTSLLRHNGLFHDGDRIYVSSSRGSAKASGRLWTVVLDDLGVAPASLHHTGNDARSDVRSARRAGMRATHVPRNNLNRYERALEAHAGETDGLSSALAGASRLARLDTPTASMREVAIADVAAGVVAPFLIGKVLWILEQADRAGLDAVHFIARDGKILHEIALELAAKVRFTGDLRYLYGSRQAWTLPALHVDAPGALSSLCPSSGDDVANTVRLALRRVEIDVEDVEAELAGGGFPRGTWDSVLAPDGCQRLVELLGSEQPLGGRVAASARSAHDRTLRYLRQEGLLDGGAVGIVDLGTGATLYNSLAALLSSVDRPAPVAFYLGLRPGVTDLGHGFPLAYLRNAVAGVGYGRTPGLLTLLEMVCTDEHGSVLGYEETGSTIEPVFGVSSDQLSEWGLASVHDTIRRVAAELVLDPDLVGSRNIDLRNAALAAFDLFWSSPTRDEAAAWGGYPFEDGWASSTTRQPIATKQWPLAAVRRQPHRHWWHGGSERLSDPATRILLRGRRRSLETARRLRTRIG